MNEGDGALPLGNPLVFEHSTPTGATEVAQRLVAFPFTPPDVKLKEKEPLSSSNDWFTKHAPDGSDRSYFPIDSVAGSLPESLAARYLVPLLPRLRPRSAHYNLCVIDK